MILWNPYRYSYYAAPSVRAFKKASPLIKKGKMNEIYAPIGFNAKSQLLY